MLHDEVVRCLHLFLGNHLDLMEVRSEVVLDRKFRNGKEQKCEWTPIKTNVRLQTSFRKTRMTPVLTKIIPFIAK